MKRHSGRNMRKLLISLLILGIVLVFSGFSLADEPGEDQPELLRDGDESQIHWAIYSDGTLAISGTGRMSDYEIKYSNRKMPAWYDLTEMYEITSIRIEGGISYLGKYAFAYLSDVSSVTIPETVTAIGSYAFTGITALQEISLPDSITLIESHAFSSTGLRSVTLPDSISAVPSSCFAYCDQLREIHFPASLRSIGEEAFIYCESLTDVRIPAGVSVIGSIAFAQCSRLESVTLPDGLDSVTLSGDAFEGTPEGIQFYCGYGSVTSQTLASMGYSSYCDPEFPAYRFQGTVPEVVDKFLTTYALPAGLTFIPEGLFSGCTNMRWLILSGATENVAETVFPESLEEIFVTDGYEDSSWATDENLPWRVYDLSLGNRILPSETERSITLLETVDLTGLFRAEPAYLWENSPIALTLEGEGTVADMIVTPLAGGDIVITATLDNPEAEEAAPGILTVHVSDFPVSIADPECSFQTGDTFTLIAFNPEGAPLPSEDLIWTSSEESVLQVNDGLAIVTGEGTATLRVTYLNKISVEMEVHVYHRSTLPDQLQVLDSEALSGSGIQSLIIPESCEYIMDKTFENCPDLREVHFLSATVEISEDAFAGCGPLIFYGAENSTAHDYASAHEGIAWRPGQL